MFAFLLDIKANLQMYNIRDVLVKVRLVLQLKLTHHRSTHNTPECNIKPTSGIAVSNTMSVLHFISLF